MQQQQMAMMQAQQQGQQQGQGQLPPGGAPGGPPQEMQGDPLQLALEADPALMAEFNALPPEEQMRVVEEARTGMAGGGMAPG